MAGLSNFLENFPLSAEITPLDLGEFVWGKGLNVFILT